MNTHVDEAIKRITRYATHPRLLALDHAVLQHVAAGRAAVTSAWRLDAISFVGALAIGMVSAIAFTSPTTASTGATLGGISHLAPSSLLERGR